MAETFPRYIFGLHDPGGEFLMADEDKRGWIVFTHELGHAPFHQGGFDYRPWTDHGYGAIARLNHGYGEAGTIPLPEHYDGFARRVRNWVNASRGCSIWVIGNEMNHGQERPDGQPITPDLYALCFTKCWQQIHSLPGHDLDQVAIGAVAPWNNTTSYDGNTSGDWVRYMLDIVRAVRELGGGIDAITLHTYTHGTDPGLVFSEAKMTAPFQDRHFQFRAYQDFMRAIPRELRRLPVYITETDQDHPWENANRGWVQNAYREINDWNTTPGNQQIRALVLYRWQFDKWHIEGVGGVQEDWKMAMDHEYVWLSTDHVRIINGHEVRSPFLGFYEEMGEDFCGPPLAEASIENGIKTQFFGRLVLQEDLSGKIVLLPVGAELLALRRENAQLREHNAKLLEQIEGLHQPANAVTTHGQPSPPQWQDITSELPRHPTKRYERRKTGDVRYLVISHSAIPGSVQPATIARFHIDRVQWPGIGYHFYLDDQGQIYKTNELTAVSHHVGPWDTVSIGICVGGNFDEQTPTLAQIESTAQLVAWLLHELDLPLDAIRGKNEFLEADSPGRQWLSGKKWKSTLTERVSAIQNMWDQDD
jgi:hypothetical protein